MSTEVRTKTVTVFGSSLPLPGEKQYEDAYRLGYLLGASGYNVCSGGNAGIMEAVSKGVTEGGEEAIGVTFHHFTVTPNQYLSQVVETNSLFERIQKLIEFGDAYVILQGGTGTLLEFSAVWELINKGLITHKPVATHSALWEQIVAPMEKQIEFEKRETGIVKCFEDIEELALYIVHKLEQGE